MAKELIVAESITDRQLLFSKLATAAGILYVFLLLALHILEPEFDPTWRFISEYALGRFGFLMNACFLLYSVAVICTLLSIRSQIKTVAGYAGLIILIISSLGIALAGIFNTDPITTEASNISFSGTMHYTGASVDFAPIGFLLFAFALGRNRTWRPVRTSLLITSAISILLTILFMASMPVDYKFNSEIQTGLIGRFLFISYLPSILAIGIYVRKAYKLQHENNVVDYSLKSEEVL
jgi:hypothetical protein